MVPRMATFMHHLPKRNTSQLYSFRTFVSSFLRALGSCRVPVACSLLESRMDLGITRDRSFDTKTACLLCLSERDPRKQADADLAHCPIACENRTLQPKECGNIKQTVPGRPNRRVQRPHATRPRSATVQLGGRRGGDLIPCTPSVLSADTTATLCRLAPSPLAGGPDPASGLPPTPVPSPPPLPPPARPSPSWEPPCGQASAAPPPSTVVPAAAAAPFATAQSVAAMECASLL